VSARTIAFSAAGLVLGALFFSGSGCVTLTPEELASIHYSSSTPVANAFQGLDAGSEAQSLHFVVKAYGPDKARQFADQAESDYGRIMQDTGLFSFQTGGQYQVVVYGNSDEYHRKSQMPMWSGGVTVQNAIYSFEGPTLRPTIAHEMTHVIFNEFMVRSRPELRWINEGLAVYQEVQSDPPDLKLGWEGRMESAKHGNLTFPQMLQAQPLQESDKDVNVWYAQAASVTKFLIERGGRNGFEQFLKGLKDGVAPDQAIQSSFPGHWQNLDQLEQDWRRS
jgi:hypothetical protein